MGFLTVTHTPQIDLGAWVGIIALVLAVPLGVCSIFVYNWLARNLERRRFIKADQTKQQAIRIYKRITAFRKGTKDKYTYYLIMVGWAAICTVASATAIILLVLLNPDPANPEIMLLLLAVGCFVIAILLMVSVYDTERKLENFSDYKADSKSNGGRLKTNDPPTASRRPDPSRNYKPALS